MPSAVDLAARLAAIVKTQEEIVSVRLDPNAVRKLAVEAAQSLTGADGAVLETVREDGDIMYHTATGTLLPHVGTLFAAESSFSGLCIEKQQPLRTDDALEDPRVNRDISKATGSRSIVVVPLIRHGSVMGVLKVVSIRTNAFEDIDTYSLQMMAGLVAAAMDHASAFEASVASEARFRLLFDRNLAGAFRSTTDGRMLNANGALAELLGYGSAAEMMEEESWNFHPERADRERMIETLMEKKSITNHPLRLKRKDGTVVDVLANMDLVPAERETWILGTIVGRQ